MNEAYDDSGATYDFYKTLFNRNSLDDAGMTLVSSVHLGRQLQQRLLERRADGVRRRRRPVFIRFTKSLDVVGHELTHGVVSHTCNLEYRTSPAR